MTLSVRIRALGGRDRCHPLAGVASPGRSRDAGVRGLEQSELEDQLAFLYGVIERDGVAVGIAPAFLMDFPLSLVAPAALQPLVRWLAASRIPRTLFVARLAPTKARSASPPASTRKDALLALQQPAQHTHARWGPRSWLWKDFAPATAAGARGLFPVVSFRAPWSNSAAPAKRITSPA